MIDIPKYISKDNALTVHAYPISEFLWRDDDMVHVYPGTGHGSFTVGGEWAKTFPENDDVD